MKRRSFFGMLLAAPLAVLATAKEKTYALNYHWNNRRSLTLAEWAKIKDPDNQVIAMLNQRNALLDDIPFRQGEDDEGWGFYTGPDFGCIHGTKAK